MTLQEQIRIIQSAEQKKTIAARKINSQDDWDYFDCRVRNQDKFLTQTDIQFNFQDYEYKVV